MTLRYVGEGTMEDGRTAEILSLTFQGVGITPQNRYEVFVDKESMLVGQWSYYADSSDAEPGFTLPWSNWEQHGAILLSADRGTRSDGSVFALENMGVYPDLPESIFSGPERVDLALLGAEDQVPGDPGRPWTAARRVDSAPLQGAALPCRCPHDTALEKGHVEAPVPWQYAHGVAVPPTVATGQSLGAIGKLAVRAFGHAHGSHLRLNNFTAGSYAAHVHLHFHVVRLQCAQAYGGLHAELLTYLQFLPRLCFAQGHANAFPNVAACARSRQPAPVHGACHST